MQTIKKELIEKLKRKYLIESGNELPGDYTDDEIIYTILLWLLEEVI